MSLQLSGVYEEENFRFVTLAPVKADTLESGLVSTQKKALIWFTESGVRVCTICTAQLANNQAVAFIKQKLYIIEKSTEMVCENAVVFLRSHIWRAIESIVNTPSRSLAACTYVRINLCNLLPREELFKLPASHAECLVERLLVRSSDPPPPIKNIVWMRICPQRESINYEFYDPAARDLIDCGFIFGRIIGYAHNEAMLYQFSAPSFSGKKAMLMIWNFMAMARMENILFTDVSTMLACCKTGALTSLHLSEVIMKGKSWYETQGATSHISKTAFRVLFNKEFVQARYGKALRGDLRDKRLRPTLDYDKFSDQCLNLYLESQTSKDAYKKARHFLNSTRVEDLCNSTQSLASSYPELGQFSGFLKKAADVLGNPKTVGNLLSTVIGRGHTSVQDASQDELPEPQHDEEHEKIHELMHDVRDRVVSNKESVFFRYITNNLRKSMGRVSYSSCVFAFIILDNFLKKIKGLNDSALNSFLNSPTPESKSAATPSSSSSSKDSPKSARPEGAKLKVTQVIYNILQPEVAEVEGIKNVTKRVCDAFLRMIENRPSSPVSAKICTNSNRHNREKWMEYSEETGISDDLLATQIAIQYLASLALNELGLIYPDLISAWETRYPMLKNNTWRFTIADLIDAVQLDEVGADELFDDLFRGAIKHASHLSLTVFKNYEESLETDLKSTYELFMISKYLCKRTELFALYLTPEGPQCE